MMISPSEGLLEGAPLAARMVLPLEFHALEELIVGREADTIAEVSAVENQHRDADEVAELKQRVAAQVVEMEGCLEAARREAWAEARETLGRECDERVATERGAVIKTCEQFGRERAKYFADVEAEVVRLALSIAARVLNREAEFDPLLLRGAVKVALDKVREESGVTLRVPEEQVEDWRSVTQDGQIAVTVVGDQRLAASECVLETNVGRVELGVKTQLKEIERGFFDLLGRRPS
jgi:flagellar assembly protein FliH